MPVAQKRDATGCVNRRGRAVGAVSDRAAPPRASADRTVSGNRRHRWMPVGNFARHPFCGPSRPKAAPDPIAALCSRSDRTTLVDAWPPRPASVRARAHRRVPGVCAEHCSLIPWPRAESTSSFWSDPSEGRLRCERGAAVWRRLAGTRLRVRACRAGREGFVKTGPSGRCGRCQWFGLPCEDSATSKRASETVDCGASSRSKARSWQSRARPAARASGVASTRGGLVKGHSAPACCRQCALSRFGRKDGGQICGHKPLEADWRRWSRQPWRGSFCADSALAWKRGGGGPWRFVTALACASLLTRLFALA